VNPEAGREALWSHSSKPASRRRVIVVGGGPAGIAAAAAAARQGHQVSLVDKRQELGGNLRTMLRVGSRQPFGGALQWFERQLELQHVDIMLGCEVTGDDFLTEEGGFAVRLKGTGEHIPFDRVILTSGARPVP